MRVIKIIFVVFILFTTTCAIAQTNTEQKKDVTTFLGIPVDGQKNEMIQKLKNKGFTYDAKHDRLKGEFNGKDVEIYVVTNKGKVYRIVVDEANYTDEANIKTRYNNLYYQFKNNSKYRPLFGGEIKEDENISYEMNVRKKMYQTTFGQMNKEKSFDDYSRIVWFTINKEYGKYGITIYYDNGYNKANGEDL